jgi:hypothetical protein
MCWNKHGEEGLNQLEAGCLNEGEVRHYSTDHDEDLDDSGLFEGNEPLFPTNVLRPKDITDQEVRGFDDGECCNVCTMLIKCRGMLSFNECTHLLN